MLLKVDCLPNAVGKQPSIPLIYLGGGWTSFLSKRFSKSVHPFQRYCLETASSAHRPTL